MKFKKTFIVGLVLGLVLGSVMIASAMSVATDDTVVNITEYGEYTQANGDTIPTIREDDSFEISHLESGSAILLGRVELESGMLLHNHFSAEVHGGHIIIGISTSPYLIEDANIPLAMQDWIDKGGWLAITFNPTRPPFTFTSNEDIVAYVYLINCYNYHQGAIENIRGRVWITESEISSD
ncbi:MAG: hypothetical protein FWC89_02255 [Defluviitaleaceae bacterium]|nr:hypothetical protein [Defluviitaleaceae bacterium]